MGLKRVITADKAGFIEYVSAMQDDHRALANTAQTKRRQHYELGIVEGMQLAISAVNDWVPEEEVSDG